MTRKEATKLGKKYYQSRLLTHSGIMNYQTVKSRIELLDVLIRNEKDVEKKKDYIDESYELNLVYIYFLRKSIPARVTFCVLLGIIYGLGLIIFLPGIIVRNKKSDICIRRINELEIQKTLL